MRRALRLGPALGRRLLAVAAVLAVAACARPDPGPTGPSGPAPYSQIPTPSYALQDRGSLQTTPEAADKVLLLKGQRKLMLLDDGRAFRTYRVSLGFEPRGPKLRSGDGRTPEGHYVLDWKNRDSDYYKSIHISYPNEQDLARARAAGIEDPGNAIMIHGLGPEMAFLGKTHRAADWTNGCIAVTNREMDEIWRLVRPGTPIEIRP